MKFITKTSALAIAVSSVLPGFAADSPATESDTQWKSSAAAGLTLTSGNSETILGTFNLATGRKWDQHELGFGADATYGQSEIDGEDRQTANSLHGFGQYNYLFTERLYGYARLDALHDEIAKVDYRITASPGVGYYFIKDKQMDLSAEAGPGVIAERLDGEDDVYVVVRIGEKFNFKISERARLWQSVEFLPQVDDFENYIVNFELGIEADLTKSLSLRSYVQDTYDNVPAPGREENDLKWVTAIAYKF